MVRIDKPDNPIRIEGTPLIEATITATLGNAEPPQGEAYSSKFRAGVADCSDRDHG